MISSQGQDQNSQSDQGNDVLIALEKSLSLDDRSSGEACHTNGCGYLDGPCDKEYSHLKVRVHLHDEEVHFPPLIDAKTGQPFIKLATLTLPIPVAKSQPAFVP